MLTPSGKGFRAIRPIYRRFRHISRALRGFFGAVMPMFEPLSTYDVVVRLLAIEPSALRLLASLPSALD